MVRNENKGARTTATPTSPAFSPAFQIGEEVEARLSSEGLRGAWYKAEVTAHNVSFSGQLTGYIVKYKTVELRIGLISEGNIRKVLTRCPKGKRGPANSNKFSASVSKKQKNQGPQQITESESESANDNANDKQHEEVVYLSDMEEAKPIVSHQNSEQLSFKKVNPLWNEMPQAWKDIFKMIPQNPHFKNLHSMCAGSVEDDMSREGAALSLMVNFASLAIYAESMTVQDDVATFNNRLACADTLETNGFNVDLIRAHLNELLRVKSELSEGRLKLSGLEHKLAEKVQENLGVLCSQTKTEEELSAVRNKRDKLKSEIIRLYKKENLLVDESEKLKKQADGNQKYMSVIESDISRLKELVKNCEHLSRKPSWRN